MQLDELLTRFGALPPEAKKAMLADAKPPRSLGLISQRTPHSQVTAIMV